MDAYGTLCLAPFPEVVSLFSCVSSLDLPGEALSLTKIPSTVKPLLCRPRFGENLGSMITLLFQLLRLLPVLCAGYRQLALENLALRHQLAVYGSD